MLRLSLFFVLTSWLLAVDAVEPQDKRPNIIYLMADDQSTYSVGCCGNKDVQTPNMDQLGRDGMIFDRHYVCLLYTSPSPRD